MSLKKQLLDETLRRLYFLTETTKKLVPIQEFTHNKRTNLVLIEILNEYNTVAETARGLLAEHIQQDRAHGVTNLDYVRLYRKLSDKEEKHVK